MERSEAGEVFTFCGGEAEDFAKTFDVNEMDCMEYRYTMDTPVFCRITDKAAMLSLIHILTAVLRNQSRRFLRIPKRNLPHLSTFASFHQDTI